MGDIKAGRQKIQTIIIQGNLWYSGTDVASALDYEDPLEAVKQYVSKIDRISRTFQYGEVYHTLLLISRDGVFNLIKNSNSAYANRLYREFGFMTSRTNYNTALDKIQEAFSDRFTQRDFQVDNYTIDLYFPTLNLAVEYDHAQHRDKQFFKLMERELDLMTKLGCRFIRFNPQISDFDVNNVITAISQQIYS